MRLEMNRQRALSALSAVMMVIGLAVLTAPSANADEETDRKFLLSLKHTDVSINLSNEDLVTLAQMSCDQFDNGLSAAQVIKWMNKYTKTRDGGVTNAGFLREAAHYYCPAYQDEAGWPRI